MGLGAINLMLCAALSAVGALGACPSTMTLLETVTVESTTYTVCEDLQTPGGGIAMIPSSGEAIWLPKSYEPYSQGTDDEYYLNLGKETVLQAKWDMLGDAILNQCSSKTPTTDLCEPTWQRVEKAVPVMRYSQGNKKASGNAFMCSPYSPESGVRTFTGSRSASVDASFSDHADDCTDNGFPRPQGYVMNLTAIAMDEPPITNFLNYVNFSAMAEGLVGGIYPNLIFYFPIIKQNFSSFGGSRYWTMIASPVPDMQGGREQSVWFRFHQVICDGENFAPPCKLHGKPQYYDTYWYSYSPITTRWIRPELMANATGFYTNLLAVKQYWDAELNAEGMMELTLPGTSVTNGTWLTQQGQFALVRSMISRDDTWHPRYGVIPGYGITLQDGFQDTFTSTATAALEWGAIPYAKGVIDNWLKYYVRNNGMTTYRAEELAQSGRMLSIFALYVSYTGDGDFMLGHFDKAKALAQWLLYRYEMSKQWNATDPRHGVIAGGDEGDGFPGNAYRGFLDIGRMWQEIGKKTGRSDVSAHAEELLKAAPEMLTALQASLKRTIFTTGNPRAPRCVPSGADPYSGTGPPEGCLGDFRGYPELMYAAVLTSAQADDMFTHLSYGNESALPTRPMTLGCTGYNNKQTTYTSYGMAYGLLQHDMVERFMLHWFGMSAHTYTRGTWTTPEAAHPDRDVGSTDYVAAGVHTAPTHLKWALVFEEPNSRTVWLGKALPRAWLAVGEEAVAISNATTRYGRVSMRVQALATTAASQAESSVSGGGGGGYTVHASVTLPAEYATPGLQPAGGVRLRIRAPIEHAGKMSHVTVGGKAWSAIDAKAETIDFAAVKLTSALLKDLFSIVVVFS